MRFPLINHICCLALLCGCVDSAVDPDFQFSTTDREPKQPTYTLSVSPTEIEVASADVTESLRITADGNWQIRRDADWINFYPSSGNGSANVTIDIKENKTAVTRSSSITIECTDNGETVRLQVTQRGKSLTLSAYQIEFGSEGGTRNINYETDGTLFVRNDNDWISCEVSDTQLKITTTGNSSQSSRTAVVYASPVKIDDISNCTAITITQAGATEDSGHSEIERDDFGNDQDWDETGVNKVVPTPNELGSPDCTSGWWSEFTDNIRVAPSETKLVTFTNYTSGANNWNNYHVILNRSDLSEYAVLRADNYGWGESYDNNARLVNSTTVDDWGTWLAGMNGAKVSLTVTNNGDGTADVKAIVTGNDGTVTYQNYLGLYPIDPDDFYFRFTVENCYLVFE